MDVVVGPGLEIPGFSGGFAINLADASITFSNPTAGGYSSTAFNGWQFFDHTGSIAAFTSVTISPATNMVGFNASRISFDANNIFVNFQGLPMNASTIVQLDINGGSTVVPEPSSLLLAGLGMFGIFGLRRRRRP